jgi:hypothetical protein
VLLGLGLTYRSPNQTAFLLSHIIISSLISSSSKHKLIFLPELIFRLFHLLYLVLQGEMIYPWVPNPSAEVRMASNALIRDIDTQKNGNTLEMTFALGSVVNLRQLAQDLLQYPEVVNALINQDSKHMQALLFNGQTLFITYLGLALVTSPIGPDDEFDLIRAVNLLRFTIFSKLPMPA